MLTHYQTLGVSEQATPDEIRRAYRQLALRTHPDRTADPAAHQQFIGFTEAYDVLSDPARRRGYDALLMALRQPPVRRPEPARNTSPPSASPRYRPAAAGPRHRSRAASIDFGAYQKTVRLWGKILLLLGLLVVADYYGMRYTTKADFISATIYNSGADTYTVRTSQGRFLTVGDHSSSAPHTTGSVQLRVSLLFGFIREARFLPAGPPLPVLFRHHALFTFTALLLLAAGLTQSKRLGDAGRVNAAILAVSFALLVVVILFRV